MRHGNAGILKAFRGAAVLLALLLLISHWPVARAVDLPPIELTARAALLIDTDTEEILYSRNHMDKAYPASLTKIMTTLLALEYADTIAEGLDLEITASETAVGNMEPGGSTSNIKPGEIMTLRDLLYCTMVVSANEACNVIAETVDGNIEAFVQRMNERAQTLGCRGTHFTNTHGLHDDDHYTTAYDSYLITKEALTHPVFMDISNTAAIHPAHQYDVHRAGITHHKPSDFHRHHIPVHLPPGQGHQDRQHIHGRALSGCQRREGRTASDQRGHGDGQGRGDRTGTQLCGDQTAV